MKPLKLRAAFKDYLWGGTKLNEQYGKASGLERTAESWELSVHPDGQSTIAETGQSLADFIAADPTVLGTTRSSDELPILVKLIDAADDLSVQVHPNDEQAREWEGENGKTEMWYVIEAEPDAYITYGVKKSVTVEDLTKAIRENTVVDLLDRVPSRAGMAFFVEAGTIHAIGKGNLIAEIQQNSNVTYRLYDYDRRDRFGNLRPLHVDKGVRTATLTPTTPVAPVPEGKGIRLLSKCPYFEVRELTVDGEIAQICREESYHYLLVVKGEVTIDDILLTAGESLFLCAGSGEYIVTGNGTVLLVSNPSM